ncbi:MAG TPA: beta-propeller fold lactonase family protein, partial [Smithellaceae bacterium]|nr:beta-propeller fold lactonase family protein [Smithellaceae bacterium]
GTLSPLSGSPFAAGTNPFSVTVAGQYAYVPNFGSNNISVYSINSGFLEQLSPGSPVDAETNPHSIRVATVNGSSFAYVSNAGSANISIYSIGTGGTLSEIPGSPVTAGTNPGPVEINSAGTYAYVVNTGSSTISVYKIQQEDVTDGAKKGTLVLSSTVATSSNPITFKMDPTGAYAYVPCFRSNAINVYTIGSDGTLTAGTTVSTGTNPYDFATVQIGSNMFAYAVNYNSNNISVYTIGSDGALSAVETEATGTNPYAITISKTSSDVYVAHVMNAGSGDIWTYTIDSSTGALTQVGSAEDY